MARDTEEALFANLGILLGMSRGALSDEQWERQRPLLPSQRPRTGRPAKDHRTMLNGILWLLRTGAPWRDLPSRYGPWRAQQRGGAGPQLHAALRRHAQHPGSRVRSRSAADAQRIPVRVDARQDGVGELGEALGDLIPHGPLTASSVLG